MIFGVDEFGIQGNGIEIKTIAGLKIGCFSLPEGIVKACIFFGQVNQVL